MRVGTRLVVVALVAVLFVVGCSGDDSVSDAPSSDSSDVAWAFAGVPSEADWRSWQETQRREGWPGADRSVMADVIMADLRFNAEAAGGEPIQVLLPFVLVLDAEALDSGDGAAVHRLPDDYFDLATAEERAAVLYELGRDVARQGEIRPVAVFFAFVAYSVDVEDLPPGTRPSESPARRQTMVASGLWADGTRALVSENVDERADGSFMMSLPTTDAITFSSAVGSPDSGGILSAFYQGYFQRE